MQLTRAADYAVRVMIHLAGQPANRRLSLPALTAATGAPESFLSKVLQSLSRAELISSQRGQLGGFQISALGRASSMRDVVEAIEGSICLNICLVSGQSCPRKEWCPAHPVWVEAQRAMLDILDRALIADLAAPQAERNDRKLETCLPTSQSVSI
jgi:Rrf2 family protein